MSYVNYTESLQRNGWRPVGETDPFAATHLGSVPFRQAFLRGFPAGAHAYRGQHSASTFSPAGGRVLHQGLSGRSQRVRRRGMGALGDMVPDQAVVTYQGTWQNYDISATTGVLQAVISALNKDGLTVRNSSTNQGVLGGIEASLGFGTTNVTLQLQVNNGQGFADPNDIISIVRHEVYVASGQFPLADSIPTVQTPGSSAPTATGQPPVTGAPPLPGQSIDMSAWLENNAPLLLLGVGAVLLLPMLMGGR